MHRSLAVLMLAVLMPLAGCGGDQLAALAPAVPAGGPRILFDLTTRPLPTVPFPNDIATRPDPGSPTGLRVNASLAAPTLLERNVRANMDTLDGWGTLSPISVNFDTPIDYQHLYAVQNDTNPVNDGVYLINLRTGERVALDFNGGNFPVGLPKTDNYFPNDPLFDQSNILFGTKGGQPNFIHEVDPNWEATHTAPQMYDDLMTFWERATNTLLIRPVRPLDQQTSYAIILTDQLMGPSGKAVDSPFPGINHAAQTPALRTLPSHLPAGIDLSHVRFTWSFTTQSTTADLEAIREGLYGRGTLSWLADAVPVTAIEDGVLQSTMKLLPQVEASPTQPNTYILTGDQARSALTKLASLYFQCDPIADPSCAGRFGGLVNELKFVDYFVMGSYDTPNFLDSSPTYDAIFHVDRMAGTVNGVKTIPTQKVYYWMTIPKTTEKFKPPFPVSIYGHGYTGNRSEGLAFAGAMARQGIAWVGIDSFGHGIDALTRQTIQAQFPNLGLAPLGDALALGRARDLDNDGFVNPGGDFWTADTFHTRDVVRQSIVDWMQLIRVFHTFDGKVQMPSALDPAKTTAAGDFNGDGIVDVSGPDLLPDGTHNPASDFFVWGISLGGIVSGLLPAIEPAISAAVPVSGGAGLGDIGIRSIQGGVVEAVFLEVMGPFILSCKWDTTNGKCADGDPVHDALAWDAQLVNGQHTMLIARKDHMNVAPGDLVKVENLTNGQTRVQVAGPRLNIRIPIPADGPVYKIDYSKDPKHEKGIWDLTPGHFREGDSIRITVCTPNADASDCSTSSSPKQVINQFMDFEFDSAALQKPPTFMGREFPVGSPLISVARGFGLQRQSPDFRRFMSLAQMILEPGDPGSYAPHYFQNLLPARAGRPANVMVMATVGDMNVPVNTGIEMARAAGVIDDATNQILISHHVVEGLSRLPRFAPNQPGYAGGAPKFSDVLCSANSHCDKVVINGATIYPLLDPTGYSCADDGTDCFDGFGAPRLSPPLRKQLERKTCTDAQAATFLNCGVGALSLPYLSTQGEHGFDIPNVTAPFDMNNYLVNMVARYFSTRGKEILHDRCLAAEIDLTRSGVKQACDFMPATPK